MKNINILTLGKDAVVHAVKQAKRDLKIKREMNKTMKKFEK